MPLDPHDVEEEHVDFYATGDRVTGEFCCAACGYGVVVRHELPRCPMCQEAIWEPAPWRPFTRAGGVARRSSGAPRRTMRAHVLAHSTDERGR